MKSLVMDIIVVDIPPCFGMLLSRSWFKKLGRTLQMDLSYATIPVFGGEFRRLYRETHLAYIVSDHQNPVNHPIYEVEQDLGTSILHLLADQESLVPVLSKEKVGEVTNEENMEGNKIWKLFFDGASSREGEGVGVVLISPTNQTVTISYKLQFEMTNNIVEYESLILEMKTAKDLGVDEITIFGDSELVVQ